MEASNIMVSNICRVSFTKEQMKKIVTAGIIPCDLEPRQIKMSETEAGDTVPCTLKWHRGSLIPTITKEKAKSLVECNRGIYMPQSLLVYTGEDYRGDSDVSSEESSRTATADLVVVAVIGENRSPLSFCRNVSSGNLALTDIVKVREEADKAMLSSNVILIED